MYDPSINASHLRECLQTLLVQYTAVDTEWTSCRRARFEAIYLLYNLGLYDALARYRRLPQELRDNAVVKTAYDLSIAYANRNYYRVLRALKTIDVYSALALHRHIPVLQVKILETIVHGYCAKNVTIPIKALARLVIPFEKPAGMALVWLQEFVANSGQEFPERDMVRFSKANFQTPKVNDLRNCTFSLIFSCQMHCFAISLPRRWTNDGNAWTRRLSTSVALSALLPPTSRATTFSMAEAT